MAPDITAAIATATDDVPVELPARRQRLSASQRVAVTGAGGYSAAC